MLYSRYLYNRRPKLLSEVIGHVAEAFGHVAEALSHT